MSWPLAELRGTTAELHERPMATRRAVDLLVLERPAVVLGSIQPADDVDHDAAAAVGVEVARRRSGGGAVLLLPERDLWLDVTIPSSDSLWDDDVGRSFHWLGDAWATALTRLGGAADLTVHRGSPVSSPWSRRVCFAGVGAGEVLSGDRKVVGISQRRTRGAARFQCSVLGIWDPVPLLGLLRLDPEERVRGLTELADVAAGIPLPAASLLYALHASLPP